MSDRHSGGSAAARERVASIANPSRLAILTRLELGPQSATEIAAALGRPVESVRHQLRRLLGAGLLTRTRGAGARGEFLYSPDPRGLLIGPRELVAARTRPAGEAMVRLLRLMFREAGAALDAGRLERSRGHVCVRLTLPLDDEAVGEGLRVQEALLASILDLGAAARGRLRHSSEEPIRATAQILFFENPVRPWPHPSLERHPSLRASAGGAAADRLDTAVLLTDPVREKLLEVLSVRPAGIAELGERIDAAPERIRYHLDRLDEAGLVRRHSVRPRRGVIERIYVADGRAPLLTREELAGRRGRTLAAFDRALVGKIFREALGAIGSEAIRERGEVCLARVPLRLDRRAVTEISGEIEAALARLLALRSSSLERVDPDHPEPRVGLAGVLFFESAPGPGTS